MPESYKHFYPVNAGRQILIADEEPENREMLGDMLQDDNEILYACDGKETLLKIMEHRATLSLLLLDLNMPEMGGLEILARLKDDPELSEIPVVVMTSDPAAEVEGLELGAIDSIAKPCPRPELVKARLHRIMELSEYRQIIPSEKKAVPGPLGKLDHINITRLAQALAQECFAIYYVNLDSGHFAEYAVRGSEHQLIPRRQGGDFFEDSRQTIRRLVMPEDQEKLLDSLNKENLARKLEKGEGLFLNYRRMLRGAPRYVSLKSRRFAGDTADIVIGLSDIDSQTKREQEYQMTREENQTFSGIARTLAMDYFTIYYVDIDTDEYIEFKPADIGRDLKSKGRRKDFFRFFRQDLLYTTFGTERNKVLTAWNKEALLNALRRDSSFSISFRKLIRGESVYVRVKVFQMVNKDNHHIVVGLSNIDAQIKREKEFAIAQQMALIDSMTGVKNKRAYAQAEKKMNESIRAGLTEPFAIAVCDINSLKMINDTMGHKAGDEYIKEACTEICNIFKHSPVFRVGGDEFAVLLIGQDYRIRTQLLADLAAVNQRNIATGGVIIATGVSDFDPEKDETISAVFNRADSAMYINKKALKGIQ